LLPGPVSYHVRYHCDDPTCPMPLSRPIASESMPPATVYLFVDYSPKYSTSVEPPPILSLDIPPVMPSTRLSPSSRCEGGTTRIGDRRCSIPAFRNRGAVSVAITSRSCCRGDTQLASQPNDSARCVHISYSSTNRYLSHMLGRMQELPTTSL
jgi:hypothetical protein